MHRRGFTIIELIVSLALLAVVMLAATSLSYAAVRATPADTDGGTILARANDAMDRMCAELQVAVSFRRVERGRITFAVAGSASSDDDRVIQYSWSGTPGDPLIRTDSAGPIEHLPAVHDLRFEVVPTGPDLDRVGRISVQFELSNMRGLTLRRGAVPIARPRFDL
mgnify:CR=1 FL=1